MDNGQATGWFEKALCLKQKIVAQSLKAHRYLKTKIVVKFIHALFISISRANQSETESLSTIISLAVKK